MKPMRKIVKLRIALELLEEARPVLRDAYGRGAAWDQIQHPLDSVIDQTRVELGRLEVEALAEIRQRQAAVTADSEGGG